MQRPYWNPYVAGVGLGLTLLLIYMLWGRIAQLVYGLSTYHLHDTIAKFVTFAFTTQEGLNMLMTGTIIGGVIALFTYAIVVVSAPMLLDRESNFFAATVTSFTAVAANPLPMLLWAAIIAALVALAAVTAFAAMVVIFPLLGLASWRPPARARLIAHGTGPPRRPICA